MKKNEEFKKINQMSQKDLLQKKNDAERSYKLSRYELVCKKSENSSRIAKNRRLIAQILTVINQKEKNVKD